MSNSTNFTLEELAEMIQQKLAQKNRDEQGVTSNDPEHPSGNSISCPQKNKTIIEPEENRDLPGSDDNGWQESSTKAMLQRRLGIGADLNRETQNQMSRAIRSLISHTCGLTLTETYTSYRNQGKWDEAVQRKYLFQSSKIKSTNMYSEVLAHPAALKANWSWALISSVMKDIITQSRSNSQRKQNAKMKKEGHIIKPGRPRLDTFLSEKPMGNLLIPVAPASIELENVISKTKSPLRPLKHCTIPHTTPTTLNSTALELGDPSHLSSPGTLINISSPLKSKGIYFEQELN